MKLILLVLTALIMLSHQSSVFNRVVLAASSDALCLDGTPGAYYISEGEGVNSTKWVIFFEGGGWCGGQDLASTLSSCSSRSTGDLGSSKAYPATINGGGILSGDKNANPGFYDWNRVFLKYCDGTGHQGTKSEPVSYQGKNLYFRGQNVTIGQLTALDFTHKFFTSATEILVSGGSAGGLAAYHWSNWVADNTKAKVWSAPDSGIFLDVINVNNKQPVYRNQFINFMKISNVEVGQPVPACSKKYPTEEWRCMFAENLHEFIKVPLFPINPLYDTWSIPNILGISCVSANSLKTCNQTLRDILEQYRVNTTKVLNAITKKAQNGAWSPACADHTYITGGAWTSASFRVPQNSVYSIENSVLRWVLDVPESENHVHIDYTAWPTNAPCARATSIREQLISQ